MDCTVVKDQYALVLGIRVHICQLEDMLHSDPTPTFSLSSPSHTYSTPETWDMPPPSPTLVSEFPSIVPAHPFDILPCLAPEPVSLASLM